MIGASALFRDKAMRTTMEGNIMKGTLFRGIASVGIAAAMMLGGAVPALAGTAKDVDFPIAYDQEGEGTRPAETLSYTSEAVSVSGSAKYTKDTMPNLTIEGVTLDGTTPTGNVTVKIPTYESVGVFTYKLTPSWTKSTDAGVHYDDIDTLYAVVTVTNATDGLTSQIDFRAGTATGGKVGEDRFAYKTGNLNMKKTVSGNMGDVHKYFKFTVTLTGQEGKTYADTYAVSANGTDSRNLGTIKVGTSQDFYLKDSETITIQGLPEGVSYTVTEDKDGYEQSSLDKPEGYTDGDEKIEVNDRDFVGFNNELEQEIGMGVFLDNAPYIAILGGVAAAAIVVVNRRRHSED